MKPRPVIIGICLAFCVATLAGVAVQARRLDALRAEEQQLQSEIQMVETNGVVTRPSISPSSELLRLRNQVSMLSRRQRELAAVPAVNEWLRSDMATRGTSEARFVGYATPEAALQTMTWAIQNHALTNLLGSLTPASALAMRRSMKNQTDATIEEVVRKWQLPSRMNLVNRITVAEDIVELQVEFVPADPPGSPPGNLRFRLINGEWKFELRNALDSP